MRCRRVYRRAGPITTPRRAARRRVSVDPDGGERSRTRLNILLLGTSNAIRKGGYVDGLRAALPGAAIDNRSVGASPGIQFARHLNEDFGRYDCVLLDSAVNDENLIAYIGDLAHYRSLMHRLMSTIAAQTRLVVVGLRNRRHFRAASPVFETYRSVARDLGLEFIDIAGFVPPGEADADLYAEEAHLTLPVAYRFGAHVAARIAAHAPDRRVPHRAYRDEFTTIEPAGEGFARASKRNSLHRLDTRLLGLGEAIRFDRTERLIGCLIDARGTWCALEFLAEGARPPLNLRHRIAPELQIKFVPFRDGISCRGIRVIAPDEAYDGHKHEEPETIAPAPILALHSLLAWSPEDGVDRG